MAVAKAAWSRDNMVCLLMDRTSATRSRAQAKRDINMSMELLGGLFSAVERNDVDTYLTFFTPNAEYKAANFPPVYGHDAIREFANRVIPYFDRVEHKVKNTWQSGNIIV